MKDIGINPWWIGSIQSAIEHRSTIPWKDMVALDEAGFDQAKRSQVCNAQAWSMIYFLRQSPVVAKRPEWAAILPTYFETMKSAFNEELAKLGEGADEDARFEAGLRARDAALEKAFASVDHFEIERAWKDYVSALSPR